MRYPGARSYSEDQLLVVNIWYVHPTHSISKNRCGFGLVAMSRYNSHGALPSDEVVSPATGGVRKIPRGDIFGACRSVGLYEKLNRVGEGTYGIVYRAKDLKTKEIVALKKIRMESEKEG